MAENKKVVEKPAENQGNATVKAAVPAKKEKPATYEVLKPFRNAETKVMQEPGDEITVTNPERFKNLVKKGIIADPDAEADVAAGEGTGEPKDDKPAA